MFLIFDVFLSLQILGWADVKHPTCDNPYKFACGNFLNQYKNHEFYLKNKGEWNFDSYFEYEGERTFSGQIYFKQN